MARPPTPQILNTRGSAVASSDRKPSGRGGLALLGIVCQCLALKPNHGHPKTWVSEQKVVPTVQGGVVRNNPPPQKKTPSSASNRAAHE